MFTVSRVKWVFGSCGKAAECSERRRDKGETIREEAYFLPIAQIGGSEQDGQTVRNQRFQMETLKRQNVQKIKTFSTFFIIHIKNMFFCFIRLSTYHPSIHESSINYPHTHPSIRSSIIISSSSIHAFMYPSIDWPSIHPSFVHSSIH